MNDRRTFLKTLASAAAMGPLGAALAEAGGSVPQAAKSGSEDRAYWISVLDRLAGPVLGQLAKQELRKTMPVETNGGADRRRFSHLEAFGRLLAGIGPWLGAKDLEDSEAKLQRRYTELALRSLDTATNPGSADFMNFSEGGQPLVDTAFLAQGILRAPGALWEPLDAAAKKRVIAALKSSRAIPTPRENNWVLFAATVEALLFTLGEPTLEDRLEDSVRAMLGWYKGDGAYGDGASYHFDYYNSFVIHPMLLDVLDALSRADRRFEGALGRVRERARRYAEIQERLVAPDGTFPSLGRSTTYRFGALQVLAQMSLRRELPPSVPPFQARCALTAVMAKMMEAPGTFDANGWLQIGFCGHQPSLAEPYISTGSLYLCSVGLLPLGPPPSDNFWSGKAVPWTSQRLWSGDPLPPDHAVEDVAGVEIPKLHRGAERA